MRVNKVLFVAVSIYFITHPFMCRTHRYSYYYFLGILLVQYLTLFLSTVTNGITDTVNRSAWGMLSLLGMWIELVIELMIIREKRMLIQI